MGSVRRVEEATPELEREEPVIEEIPLRVVVAMLTRNRAKLFKKTVKSLMRTEMFYELCVADMGSTDGTEKLVKELGGFVNPRPNPTVGYGMNLIIGKALQFGPDIVLFTADDYEYKRGWLEALTAFWAQAPADVALVSCNLEPDYDWNTVTGVVDAGGQRAAVRDSVPGANWSFRASEWGIIGPVADKTGGEDLEICRRLRSAGRRLCALDLTKHIGEAQSSWGNQSHLYARPLDRKRWGL